MHESIVNAHKRVDTKVSWWILTPLIAMFVIMLGAQFTLTLDVRDKVTALQAEVKQIKTQINP